MIRIKLYFISLLFLIPLIYGCEGAEKEYNPTATFEKILKSEEIKFKSDERFLLWTTSSCIGCRKLSVELIRSNNSEIIIIVPFKFKNEVSTLETHQYIIDENNSFNNMYFGIDNIGIIQMKEGKVASFKNYDANQMEEFRSDVLNRE